MKGKTHLACMHLKRGMQAQRLVHDRVEERQVMCKLIPARIRRGERAEELLAKTRLQGWVPCEFDERPLEIASCESYDGMEDSGGLR